MIEDLNEKYMKTEDELTESAAKRLDAERVESAAIFTALAQAAIRARTFSYSPYSKFAVGAALLAENGQVYTGCNIENAAYTPSNCAERTAFFKAVSEGVKDFKMIVIAGGPAGSSLPLPLCAPCGVCRQVMMEFCDPDHFQIILVRDSDNYEVHTLRELFPEGFGPGNLR